MAKNQNRLLITRGFSVKGSQCAAEFAEFANNSTSADAIRTRHETSACRRQHNQVKIHSRIPQTANRSKRVFVVASEHANFTRHNSNPPAPRRINEANEFRTQAFPPDFPDEKTQKTPSSWERPPTRDGLSSGTETHFRGTHHQFGRFRLNGAKNGGGMILFMILKNAGLMSDFKKIANASARRKSAIPRSGFFRNAYFR